MKKLILSVLCTTCLIISGLSATASAGSYVKTDSWPEGPKVYAEAAIVMEASTGLILYEKIYMKHIILPV